MHTLPPLPYEYNALEPYIDEQTMTIHHTKHHQAYIDKLNDALKDQPDLNNKPLEELLTTLDQIPEQIRTIVRNNGGGHWNHSFFWQIMAPPAPSGQTTPIGELANTINAKFSDFDSFKKAFADTAVARFGSGWVWLVVKDSGLEVVSTPNQDNPLMDNSGMPILGLDVWEHSYYLKYQNRRPEYIENWWNVVNWDKVAENFHNTSK